MDEVAIERRLRTAGVVGPKVELFQEVVCEAFVVSVEFRHVERRVEWPVIHRRIGNDAKRRTASTNCHTRACCSGLVMPTGNAE